MLDLGRQGLPEVVLYSQPRPAVPLSRATLYFHTTSGADGGEKSPMYPPISQTVPFVESTTAGACVIFVGASCNRVQELLAGL